MGCKEMLMAIKKSLEQEKIDATKLISEGTVEEMFDEDRENKFLNRMSVVNSVMSYMTVNEKKLMSMCHDLQKKGAI